MIRTIVAPPRANASSSYDDWTGEHGILAILYYFAGSWGVSYMERQELESLLDYLLGQSKFIGNSICDTTFHIDNLIRIGKLTVAGNGRIKMPTQNDRHLYRSLIRDFTFQSEIDADMRSLVQWFEVH